MRDVSTVHDILKRRSAWGFLVLLFGWLMSVLPFAITKPDERVTWISAAIWVIGVMLLTLCLFFLVRWAVRCPRCRRSLASRNAYNLPCCPQCGLDLGKPYV